MNNVYGFYKDFSSLLQQSSLGFYKSSHLGSDKTISRLDPWLDPWAVSLGKFTKYFDSLTTTKVYETLVKHQEAIHF